MDKDMPELLPCPFCGGDAKFTKGYWFEESWSGETVQCTGCQAIMGRPFRVSELKSIAAWNRRADLARQPSEADAARVADEQFSMAGWHPERKCAGLSIAAAIRQLGRE